MDTRNLEYTNKETESIITELLELFFYDKVKSFYTSSSYEINSDRVFIIKLLPLKTPIVIVPKNEKNEIVAQKLDSIFKTTPIEILISQPISLEKYQKTTTQTSISSKIPIIVINFDDYDIVSQITIFSEFLAEIRKSLTQVSPKALFENLDIPFNEKQLEEAKETVETKIREFIDQFFLTISGIPWDLDELLYSLDKVSFQFLINQLLTRLSEDEILVLINSLEKSGKKILQNLSEGAKEKILITQRLDPETIKILSSTSPDKTNQKIKKLQEIRKFEETFPKIVAFHTSIVLNKILEQNDNTPFSKSLNNLRETTRKIFYKFRTSSKILSRVLKLLEELPNPLDILNYIPRNDLPKALVGIPKENLKSIFSHLSERGKNQLIEDIEFFSKTNQDFINEKSKFINAAIKSLFKHQLKTRSIWEILAETIPKLSPPKIYYAIYSTRFSTFLIFTETLYKLPKREGIPKDYKTSELYDKFIQKLDGIAKISANGFIKKHFTLVFAYGETKINESLIEFAEQLYFTVKMDEILEES